MLFSRQLPYFIFLLLILWCFPACHSNQSPTHTNDVTPAKFADISIWPVQHDLPPLLRDIKSRSIKSVDDWESHRSYLLQLLQHYQYGHAPAKPRQYHVQRTGEKNLSSDLLLESYQYRWQNHGIPHSFRFSLIRSQAAGAFPIIIKNDRYTFDYSEIADSSIRSRYTEQGRLERDFWIADLAAQRGYIYCKFNREDIAPDHKADSIPPIFAMYPEYDWGTITVWAWTYQLLIDWLIEQPWTDADHLVATGHSRGGKTALWAGILDQRIKITVPNSSGLGGTASLRYYDLKRGDYQSIHHHKERFPYWWTTNWYTLADHLERIPFDAHFAKALIAPRALLNTHARHDFWANPYGTHLTYLAAQPVYRLYHAEDHHAIHWRDGGHGQEEEDWLALLDFCDWIIHGRRPAWNFAQNPYPDDYQYEDLTQYDVTQPVSTPTSQ